MAERSNKRSRIFQLALKDAIQSYSRVSNMESARCITRETEEISPSEDKKLHFTSKPKVKQKSSEFFLQHEPKPSLAPRQLNSKYYHASYETNCESSGVSECGSISSEYCLSTKYSDSSTTSGALASVKKEDCIPFIYARPISSCEFNQSEIDCGNLPLIEPPTINQFMLNKGEQSSSFSNEDQLPQKVLTQPGFCTSDVYESRPGDWNASVKFGTVSSIPPPKSSKHFSDSFLFPSKVESSSCEFFIPNPKVCKVNCNLQSTDTDQIHTKNCDAIKPSLKSHINYSNLLPFSNVTNCRTVIPNPKSRNKVESSSCEFLVASPKGNNVNFKLLSIDKLSPVKSLVPRSKMCDSKSFSLESCDSYIPRPKSCDSKPFFSFHTQTNSAPYETIVPPSKGCVGNPFFFTDQTHTENITDRKTVIPSTKSLSSDSYSSGNQSNLETGDSTISSSTGYDFFYSFPLNVQASSATNKTTMPAPKSHSGNSYPFANVMDWTDQKDVNRKSNECSVKDISVCDINIPLLKTSKKNSLEMTSLKIEYQNKLAVLDTCDTFTDDYLDELIEVGTRSLNNSMSEHVNNIPGLDIPPPPITCQTNRVFPVTSQFDLLSIAPKSHFDAQVEKLIEENNSNHQCHLGFLNAEPIGGSNYINQLKVDSAISSTQTHLNVLPANPNSNSDYYNECSNALNDSSLNESNLQNSLKNSRELQSNASRKDFFKKSSKSIDSGLGFLSEENLTISASDIPSVFSESELNILTFSHQEDDSASLQSSELDTYVESEKERIDNLIDQLLEM